MWPRARLGDCCRETLRMLRPGRSVWRRCSSVEYRLYAPSSCLASRPSRRESYSTFLCDSPLGVVGGATAGYSVGDSGLGTRDPGPGIDDARCVPDAAWQPVGSDDTETVVCDRDATQPRRDVPPGEGRLARHTGH